MSYRLPDEVIDLFWTVLERRLATNNKTEAYEFSRVILDLQKYVKLPSDLIGMATEVRTELKNHLPVASVIQKTVSEPIAGETISTEGEKFNVLKKIVKRAKKAMTGVLDGMSTAMQKEYESRFLREDTFRMADRLPLSVEAHRYLERLVNDDALDTVAFVQKLLYDGQSDKAYAILGVSEQLFNFIVSKANSVEDGVKFILSIDTSRYIVLLIFMRAMCVAVCSWVSSMRVEDLAIILIRHLNIQNATGLDVAVGVLMNMVVDRMLRNIGTTAMLWMSISDVIPHLSASAVYFHLYRWTRHADFSKLIHGMAKDMRLNIEHENYEERFCGYHMNDLDSPNTAPIRFIIGVLFTHVCVVMRSVREVQGSCAHTGGNILYGEDMYNYMYTLIHEMENPTTVHRDVESYPTSGWEKAQFDGVKMLLNRVPKPFETMQKLYKVFMTQATSGGVKSGW